MANQFVSGGKSGLYERWISDCKRIPGFATQPFLPRVNLPTTAVDLMRASVWAFHVAISGVDLSCMNNVMPLFIRSQPEHFDERPHLQFMGLQWSRHDLSLVESLLRNLLFFSCGSARTISICPVFSRCAVPDYATELRHAAKHGLFTLTVDFEAGSLLPQLQRKLPELLSVDHNNSSASPFNWEGLRWNYEIHAGKHYVTLDPSDEHISIIGCVPIWDGLLALQSVPTVTVWEEKFHGFEETVGNIMLRTGAGHRWSEMPPLLPTFHRNLEATAKAGDDSALFDAYRQHQAVQATKVAVSRMTVPMFLAKCVLLRTMRQPAKAAARKSNLLGHSIWMERREYSVPHLPPPEIWQQTFGLICFGHVLYELGMGMQIQPRGKPIPNKPVIFSPFYHWLPMPVDPVTFDALQARLFQLPQENLALFHGLISSVTRLHDLLQQGSHDEDCIRLRSYFPHLTTNAAEISEALSAASQAMVSLSSTPRPPAVPVVDEEKLAAVSQKRKALGDATDEPDLKRAKESKEEEEGGGGKAKDDVTETWTIIHKMCKAGIRLCEKLERKKPKMNLTDVEQAEAVCKDVEAKMTAVSAKRLALQTELVQVDSDWNALHAQHLAAVRDLATAKTKHALLSTHDDDGVRDTIDTVDFWRDTCLVAERMVQGPEIVSTTT